MTLHAMFRTLIDAVTLNAHLALPNWRVIDCRFDLQQPEKGGAAWREEHVPGAVYAHLERDLTGPVTATSGRHPLPDPDRLAKRLGEWGIDAGTQVVIHDSSGGAMAARLWWLLRWLGHESVAVLDGGWQAWKAQGFATDAAVPVIRKVMFPRRASLAGCIESNDVLAAVNGNADWRTIDARSVERFRGEIEPIDSVAGRIPGARNRPFTENLDAEGKFLAPEILRERFHPIAAGRADRVVHYCGSGVTACHNVLAMEHAGLTGSRLYPGSWSEWIRDPARPVERGV